MRVAIVADDPLVRGGLSAAFAQESGLQVASEVAPQEAGRGRRALGDVDVLVWDFGREPLANGRLAVLEEFRTLALVSDDERGLEALRAGAQGVLFRSAEPERLIAAVFSVARAVMVIEPSLISSLLSGPRAQAAVDLTPRELEVLNLLAEGLSNKLIASRLKISEHTAKFHVNAILTKLGADTRTEAVVQAARRGLLML